MKARLQSGELEDREVEITFPGRSVAPVSILGAGNLEQMEMDLQNMFEKIMPKQSQTRKLPVRQARPILLQQEIDALLDPEKINQAAVSLAEESGIVFIDEIDKITTDEGSRRGPDVSRQGVQRDLLPIVEGTTVNTKHGPVKTDHILFIAAGAFHASKPSDLMPELQGRFPDPGRNARPHSRRFCPHFARATRFAAAAISSFARHGRHLPRIHRSRH